MKINILHIIDSLRTGGAETIAVNSCNALNKEISVNAYLCATRLEGALKNNIDDLSMYLYLNKKKPIDISALRKLFVFIKKKDITILHAHTTSFFIAILVKIYKPKIKIIWHNHTGANVNLFGWRKLFLKSCSFFFNTTINVNQELNQWSKRMLFSKNNYVLNNFATFKNKQNVTKLKGTSSKKIVCVAGLREEKDHINLLVAFSQLLKQFPDTSLHLIGKDYKNEYSESIKEYITQHNLVGLVFLYNNCSDIYNVLSQATIGVLSSKSEGLPIALLEYGLIELPVVVTNVGDCSKLVAHDQRGRVVQKEDASDLAKSLLFLLKNEHYSLKLAANLKQFVEENYSSENYIKQLIKIYRID